MFVSEELVESDVYKGILVQNRGCGVFHSDVYLEAICVA